MTKDSNHVNLLWTGGWDSTFQLLRVLLIGKCLVTPYYLIHEKRPSTGKELKNMKRIKDILFKTYPEVRERLLPIRYHSVNDVSENPEITQRYTSIKKEFRIGEQYEWLARFCHQHSIEGMQLSIEPHLNPDPEQYTVDEYLKPVDSIFGENFIMDPKYKDHDMYQLFKYFEMPLMHLNKVQMKEMADENNWMPIMRLTWFCHTPTRRERPCGTCRPCQIAIEETFGWRIPRDRRMLGILYGSVFLPVKAFLRKTLISMGLFTPKNER